MNTVNASRDAAATPLSHQQDSGQQLQRALRASVSQALDVRRQGHGLHGMVLAIRDSLARGDDANALETKIDKALDAASKHLAEQGYSQDEIDAAISKFRNRLAREIDDLASRNAPSAGGDAVTTGAAQRTAIAEAAREVKKEKFSLDILTAEGDRVSIRFKSVSVTNVAAAQVSDGTNTATAVEGSVISRGRFKVEVDGDLNDAEQAAIGDLLDKVDDIAQDFFGGDVQEAFAAASRVGLESDALSAFSLRLSYSRTVAAQAYANTAALGGVAAPDVPAPAAPAPAPTSPAAAAKAPTPTKLADVATPAPVVDSTSAPVSTAAVGDAPAAESPATPAPVVDAPSARQTIASFTKDVLARLSTGGDTSYAKFSMHWKVQFLVSALSSAAVTPAQQDATQALGEALDSQTPPTAA
ncbi:MAG TPA: hypothetical protein VMF52_11215 [Steroidobacteraceae bacterium]|nr:hypothetical protein [Steroidobacteraceae bacterium]